MKVAIQGIQGAFHEVAARKFFTNMDIEIIPAMTFAELVSKVENNNADIGIIAVENTISGTIHQNFNLIKSSSLKVVGEVFISIEQNLMALPGVTIDQINEVHSHYMAINQCRQFLNQYPSWNIVETEDTALSAKLLAENKTRHIAVIGSGLAAQLYGLQVIVPSIQTNKKNYTRFWIISKNEFQFRRNVNKASLSFIISNEKGSLARVLTQISWFDINLTKLESVPIIGQPWNYMFFADFVFEYYEDYQKVLAYFKEQDIEFEVLGEYENGL